MVRLFFVFFTLCLIQDAFPAPVEKDRCSDGMDIALLLDASGSIGKSGWEKVRLISKHFVDAFDVSDSGTHFALLTFSTEPRIEMKFNKYNGANLNGDKIKGDIDTLKVRKGFTFIDKALLAAEKHIFTSEAGMRKDKRKVAVVLTDGIQTKDKGPFTPLLIASRGLKSKGVEVYALGVGNDIDVIELLNMASSADNVFSGRWILSKFDEFRNEFCKVK